MQEKRDSDSQPIHGNLFLSNPSGPEPMLTVRGRHCLPCCCWPANEIHWSTSVPSIQNNSNQEQARDGERTERTAGEAADVKIEMCILLLFK